MKNYIITIINPNGNITVENVTADKLAEEGGFVHFWDVSTPGVPANVLAMYNASNVLSVKYEGISKKSSYDHS
jgi:hypothetical protein